ncbi:phage portal protein family protein [Helicobacter suis]|uniref:phage portal protein family protein n=1 Tax=Helicobacter suis TaxID=104628 RepID=UPI002492D837|nr:DUF935 family protein [Helicobacter suis]
MGLNLAGALAHQIPNFIDYEFVKWALQSERYEELVKVFRYFLRFDAQISSEVFKRRLQVAKLPLILECESQQAQEAFKHIQKKGFYQFVFDCTSALFFGCAYFIKGFSEGGINFKLIPHHYVHYDGQLEKRPFIFIGGDKIYLDNRPDILSVCDLNLYDSSAYRVVSICALKYLALGKYMSYLENLSIPPLVAKSPDLEKNSVERLLDNLEDLRSASVGVFGSDDQIDLLTGSVDKDAFLSFVRYCDECISKVINGQVLAGNAVEKGTQALGTVHENVGRSFLEFDARFIAVALNEALKEAFKLYLDKVPPFVLSLDTNTEVDEARQVQVYKALYDMGLQVDLETLQKAFNVPLSRIQQPLNGGLMEQTNTIEKAIEKKPPRLPLEIEKQIENLFHSDSTQDYLIDTYNALS